MFFLPILLWHITASLPVNTVFFQSFFIIYVMYALNSLEQPYYVAFLLDYSTTHYTLILYVLQFSINLIY